VTLSCLPTFIKLRSFLLLEEQRLGHQARVVAHNALLAQAYLAAGAQALAHLAQAHQAASSPLSASFNPAALGLYGAGASYAGAPSSSSSTSVGKKKQKKNPSTATNAPIGGAPSYGTNQGGYRPPAPHQPTPAAPSVAGTFQAWAAPGILGPCPPTPVAPHALNVNSAPAGPATSAPQWDQSALIAALNQLSLQQSSGNGDPWVFDSGASAHLSFGFGIPSSPPSQNSPSQIIVSDGSTLPITGVGSLVFPTSHRSLSLHNILISPGLIKNLVSVCAFTHDNFVSIEFDLFGFSIKDLATGRVIHRCNSTGDLYPFVHPPQCLNVTDSSLAAAWTPRRGGFGAWLQKFQVQL
jgi:hypothetical protein